MTHSTLTTCFSSPSIYHTNPIISLFPLFPSLIFAIDSIEPTSSTMSSRSSPSGTGFQPLATVFIAIIFLSQALSLIPAVSSSSSSHRQLKHRQGSTSDTFSVTPPFPETDGTCPPVMADCYKEIGHRGCCGNNSTCGVYGPKSVLGCCHKDKLCIPDAACTYEGFKTCPGEASDVCCESGNICYRDSTGSHQCRDPNDLKLGVIPPLIPPDSQGNECPASAAVNCMYQTVNHRGCCPQGTTCTTYGVDLILGCCPIGKTCKPSSLTCIYDRYTKCPNSDDDECCPDGNVCFKPDTLDAKMECQPATNPGA